MTKPRRHTPEERAEAEQVRARAGVEPGQGEQRRRQGHRSSAAAISHTGVAEGRSDAGQEQPASD